MFWGWQVGTVAPLAQSARLALGRPSHTGCAHAACTLCSAQPLMKQHPRPVSQPTEEEIQFILDAIADYLVVKV